MHTTCDPPIIHGNLNCDTIFIQVNCEQMKIGRAIHFSHKKSRDAFDAGLFPIDIEKGHDESHHRAEGAQVFLDDWRKQCLDQE